MDSHNRRQHRKAIVRQVNPRRRRDPGQIAFNKVRFSEADRALFGKGARAGKKVGFGDGINRRLFRNVTPKRTDPFAAGFRAAYPAAFKAGNNQQKGAATFRRSGLF